VALILPPPVAKLAPDTVTSGILQPLAEKLPWAHHVILLEKVKDRAARLWYMQAAVENGWSRAVLGVQIEQHAHRRAGKAVTNFAATLPPQSDLAQQTLKDPYVFDFLALDAAACERELEHGLIDHVEKFLVTLGAGFAFVSRPATSQRKPTHQWRNLNGEIGNGRSNACSSSFTLLPS
jgi:predicted nuclease of restriction endonuclease-like (RecB) superfamily